MTYNTKNDSVVNGGNPPLANLKPKSTSGLIGIQYTFQGM